MTMPDDALLWARKKLADQWRDQDDVIASEYRAGNMDNNCEELRDLSDGFRAGQAHADARLLEAIAGPEAWLDGWAQHVGNCQGGYVCTCGLTRARSELSAAIAAAKGTDQ
jgi:hypothetical protein